MTNLQKKSYSLQEAGDPSNHVLRISHKGAGRAGINNALKLSKNFTLVEFVLTATGFENVPGLKEISNLKLLAEKILQPLHDAVGRPIVISSGFRSELVNAAIGGRPQSPHLAGRAADIHIPGMTNQMIIDLIKELKLPCEMIEEHSWVSVSIGPNIIC